MSRHANGTHKPNGSSDARQFPRLRLPAMYTLMRVRPQGAERYMWTGYIYDISASGMRFELDTALPPGTTVEFRAMLPGQFHTTFSGAGTVVRLHDDEEEKGPMRMGLSINAFARHGDRRRLSDYLQSAGLKAA